MCNKQRLEEKCIGIVYIYVWMWVSTVKFEERSPSSGQPENELKQKKSKWMYLSVEMWHKLEKNKTQKNNCSFS